MLLNLLFVIVNLGKAMNLLPVFMNSFDFGLLCKTKIMTWPSYKHESHRSPQNKDRWDQLYPGGFVY